MKKIKKIWSSDLVEVDRLWKEVYLLDGWDVEKPVEIKWNWIKFEYQYLLIIKKSAYP